MIDPDIKVLRKPLSLKTLRKKLRGSDGPLCEVVAFDLADLIEAYGEDTFSEMVNNAILGGDAEAVVTMTDVEYRVVGCKPAAWGKGGGKVLIEVTAQVELGDDEDERS